MSQFLINGNKICIVNNKFVMAPDPIQEEASKFTTRWSAGSTITLLEYIIPNYKYLATIDFTKYQNVYAFLWGSSTSPDYFNLSSLTNVGQITNYMSSAPSAIYPTRMKLNTPSGIVYFGLSNSATPQQELNKGVKYFLMYEKIGSNYKFYVVDCDRRTIGYVSNVASGYDHDTNCIQAPTFTIATSDMYAEPVPIYE